MRSVTIYVTRSVVCLSVCVCVCVCVLCTRVRCEKRLNRSRCRLTADLLGSKEPFNRWGPDPPQEGALRGGHVPAHDKLPAHGEWFCPAQEADEFIRRREGRRDKAVMRPLDELRWTLVKFSIVSENPKQR